MSVPSLHTTLRYLLSHYTLKTESCIENDTRLNGGVVQVCHEGQWGLVCDHDRSWSSNDARVVCRQEGFSSKCQLQLVVFKHCLALIMYSFSGSVSQCNIL